MGIGHQNLDLPILGQSCWDEHETVLNASNFTHGKLSPKAAEIAKALWIITVTILIVSLNVMMIVVLHSKQYSKFLSLQPRLFLTSLAFTDMAVGLLVTPFSIYPTLYHCWPFGVYICAAEALLISALFHQSTLSLVNIAVDRYIYIIHPLRYNTLMTRKVCICLIVASWLLSFTVYSALIFPNKYHFDDRGIMTCEPYYANKSIIIFATSLFYFPPVLILFYCYTTVFLAIQRQLRMIHPGSPSVMHAEETDQGKPSCKVKKHRSTVTLATISFSFLVAVTPWTLTELISSCLEISPVEPWEFIVTWIAVSNSFWNPITYGLLSKPFRNTAKNIFQGLVGHRKNSNTSHRLSS